MKGFCIFAVVVSLGLITRPQGTFGATMTPLWEFTGGHDGAEPEAGLVQGSDSNFYGTTYSGGTNDWGTVFRVTTAGSFTNLYFFTGLYDGGEPAAGLALGNDGNFYGTTYSGGSNGVGVVFRITAQGTLSTLWQFSGGSDGGQPEAGLVQGIDSNFYGTTHSDGTKTMGTVFKITSTGTLTPLWQFTGGTDGAYPYAGLIQGSDGNFYGTAAYGGSGNNGAVFKITSAGTLTPLHSFSGGSGGATPEAGLIQATDGLFYGTTAAGGSNELGTVFSISSTGSFTNLYLFSGVTAGSDPLAALIQGIDSNFYGTAYSGGTSNAGTVFEFPLPSGCSSNFMPQISAIHIVGTNVVVTLPTIACQTYQLQSSESMNPTNWISTGSAVAGTGSPIMLTNVGGALQTQQFYRVEIMTSGGSTQAIAQISSIQAVGTNMVITITAVAADTYQLQYSNTMVSPTWINDGNSTNGVTGALELVDVGGALVSERFYQVMITIPE